MPVLPLSHNNIKNIFIKIIRVHAHMEEPCWGGVTDGERTGGTRQTFLTKFVSLPQARAHMQASRLMPGSPEPEQYLTQVLPFQLPNSPYLLRVLPELKGVMGRSES